MESKIIKLKIFNIIFLVLSAVSICMLLIQPFFQLKVKYILKADVLEENLSDLSENIDIDEVVGDGIAIEIGIEVDKVMLIKSVTEKDGEKFLNEQVLGRNIDKIVATIKPLLSDTIKKAVKSVAKKEVEKQLKEQLQTAFGDNVDVKQKLEDAGVNVGEITNTIFDAFTAENATLDSFSEVLATQVNTAIDSLKEYNPEFAEDFGDISKNEVKELLGDFLEEAGLVDKDGNILDITDALTTLVAKFADTSNSLEGEGEPQIAEEGEGTDDTVSLEDTIKNLIYDKIPDLINSYVSIAFMALTGIWAFFLLTWAWVAIWSFIKLFAKRQPGIFTGIICFISGLLQIIIGIGLTYGVSFVLSGKVNIDILNEIPAGLTIAIATSVMVPAFCVLAKWVLNVFYHFTKRSLKRDLKS